MVDEANWVNALRTDFDPEISIAIREYKIHGLTVYAVSVDEAVHKPVICKKSRSKLVADKNGKQKGVMIVQESAVYYRYAGQTKTIGYADFQHMLAEREAAYLRKMMETLQVVQKVGVANAGVMDMSGPKSSVYMSKETAKGLNLIDKANLVEKKGAPAYVVMGNVDVNQIVHAPLEDADKNIPTEAALSGLVLGFLLFGSSLRWGSVYIGSARHKPLNSRVACGVDQPFSRIGFGRSLVGADVSAPVAAGLASEPRLDI
jgi:hypothetical protein